MPILANPHHRTVDVPFWTPPRVRGTVPCMPNPSQHRMIQAAWFAGLSLLALLCLPYLLLPAAMPREVSTVAQHAPGVWLTGSAPQAYNMPAQPYAEQRRPPCGSNQKEFNGGCWVAMEQRPDGRGECYDAAPRDGKCWIPVHISNIPLTSINRR